MKKILLIIPAAIILLMALIIVRMKSDARDPYPNISANDVTVPTFKEVKFPFVHKHDQEKSLPFMASAVIDVDNDGIEEVFIGGGFNQQDGLFAFKDGQFVDISSGRGLTK